jgi:hypothetical protein
VLTLKPVWVATQGVDFDFKVEVNLKTAPLQRPLHKKWH